MREKGVTAMSRPQFNARGVLVAVRRATEDDKSWPLS